MAPPGVGNMPLQPGAWHQDANRYQPQHHHPGQSGQRRPIGRPDSDYHTYRRVVIMRETYQALLSEINRMQPLNPVMLELLSLINNPDTQAEDLTRIISTDANTSATILKIANSPFYGMSGRIRSVKDACVLLGFDQLRNIIYATALEQASSGTPHQDWRDTLRRHTLAVALIADGISQQEAIDIPRGQAYSLGLLHELGKQVLISELPDLFSEFMAAEGNEKREFFSFFNEAGSIIAKRWRLPEVFRACIKHVRSRNLDFKPFNREVRLVQCAHRLAQAWGYDTPGETSTYQEAEVLNYFYPDMNPDEVLPPVRETLINDPELSA
ncbi:MAG: hypothetical protein CML06_01540 [Pseudomonadales bacterium]|nr:hypothetical protein [Pseudomonadales bacterium]